ncbi:hypothetical protein T12_14836 [Trichinella patagoniensis]|uniref:Uncharacterized protein n=1 Tax=Trichinella patagoniensis TaxID=990121 RepID=A0A0V0ZZE9_9BILA|nr:hypothetical protein T12_14836 [Trichinella patagoniensis]
MLVLLNFEEAKCYNSKLQYLVVGSNNFIRFRKVGKCYLFQKLPGTEWHFQIDSMLFVQMNKFIVQLMCERQTDRKTRDRIFNRIETVFF